MSASREKTRGCGRRKDGLAPKGNVRSAAFYPTILPVILLSAVTWSLSHYVVQPLFGSDEYYIDEEFHVPQAQHYCRGAFQKWDPKITTLPGIYLLSTIVLVHSMKIYNTILSLIGILKNDVLQEFDPCSLIALRAVNAIGAPACSYYAYQRCQLLLYQIKFVIADFEFTMIDRTDYLLVSGAISNSLNKYKVVELQGRPMVLTADNRLRMFDKNRLPRLIQKLKQKQKNV